jgi:mycothiol synthase
VQYHFQMRIQMEAPPQPPEWPAGVKVRTAVPGRDDRAIHALIQAAFDRPGRTPQPLEAWQEFMMQPGLFEAELWFLAEADGELAGACLCFAYPEMGWVRQLGVAKGQRQRGLGTALLWHAFGEFWKREMGLVGLAVNAENETAVGLYEAAGMKRVLQYDEYQQSILSP